jgi:pimeloyl-ACP methyl ester carboxylesterase
VVAALWPQRVRGLVSCTAYQIQDIANSRKTAEPEQERRFWYQYYFQTERGRNGLAANRAELGRLLWKLWSPTWPFDEAVYKRTAASFDNPDFVDVVIHSYRHRMGNAPGDPRYAAIEAKLAQLPKISVPTIAVHGAVDDVNPVQNTQAHQRYFTGRYERRVFENVGHNPPQEAPRAFADAILDVCK